MKTSIKILSVLFIFAVAFSSCKKDSQPLYKVEYKIASVSNMNVTYTDQNGVTKTATNVSSNWTYGFGTNGHGQVVTLTISSVNSSPVSGAVFINGQQASQNNDDAGSTSMTATIP